MEREEGRTSRVEALREAVAAGTYKPDADAIATAIRAKAQEKKSAKEAAPSR